MPPSSTRNRRGVAANVDRLDVAAGRNDDGVAIGRSVRRRLNRGEIVRREDRGRGADRNRGSGRHADRSDREGAPEAPS
jgi:hypothetical protein